MDERDAFEEWWAEEVRAAGNLSLTTQQVYLLEQCFRAGARSRDAEIERQSYDRGYETGCAAASYTNEETALAYIHVLEQDLDQLHKVRSAELDELASIHQERDRLREVLREWLATADGDCPTPIYPESGGQEPCGNCAPCRARSALGEEG